MIFKADPILIYIIQIILRRYSAPSQNKEATQNGLFNKRVTKSYLKLLIDSRGARNSLNMIVA